MTSYSTQSLPARRYRDELTFTERMHQVLTERECSIFDKGLAVYHKRRDVTGFVQSLSMVLNTNQKRQLLVPIRDSYVKPSDKVKFNSLCIKYGIALPARGTLPKKQLKRMSSHDDISGPKLIEVRRGQNGDWGFTVRGGIEVGMGIFVSWIDHESAAETAGLRIGDYIHRVDDVNFDGFSQLEAAQFFRSRSRIRLLVTSYGKIPGFQSANKFYCWIDRNGKSTTPPLEDGDIKMDALEKQVSMTVEPGMELGVSIRGGAEHGLGIYVSVVDQATLADLHGIQPGDQILEVNGVIFYNILHADAAKALRAQRTMIMKVKDIGKIPTSRVPMQPRLAPEETMSPSSRQSELSLSSHSKKTRRERAASHQEKEIPVMLKKNVSLAKNELNEVARSILNKSEMSAFTYYISQYEHEQIVIEVLVSKLLKLFNTREKMQLISEVHNIIQPRDIDTFTELTIYKEIKSRKARYSTASGNSNSSDDEGSSYPIQLRHHHMRNGDEEYRDELDDIPTRLSPIGRVKQKSSTPDQQRNLIAKKMRERRNKLHESVLTTVEDFDWDESYHMNGGTLQRLKQEHELEKKHILEEKDKEMEAQKEKIMKEEFEPALKAQEEETRKKVEETLRREVTEQMRQEELERLEQEFNDKLEHSLREEKQKAREEREKREQLEQEMKGSFKNEIESKIRLETKNALEQQFEQKIEKTMSSERQRTEEEIKRRQDLEKEVKVTWQNQLQQQKEMNDKLEKSIQEERKRSDEERKRREQLEKELMQKTALSFEEKDKLRTDLENKLRKEAEERTNRENKERSEREAREKARLDEEIQNNKSLRDQLEEERQKREMAEKEKREILEQKRQKRYSRDPVLDRVKMRTAVESDEVESKMDAEHMRRLAQEEAELRRIAEEEKRLRLLEEEEEAMREREDIAEMRRAEIEEEEERQEELDKRRKEDEKMERQLKREDRERARKAEEERVNQLREEEERKQREEEQRQEEERRRMEEEDKKRQKKKVVPPQTMSFEPSAMDDIVNEMAKMSPMPSPREGHVSFEDERRKQQNMVEQERKKAERMLASRLQRHKETTKQEDGITFGGYTGLKGKIIKVNVTKVNRKLGIAVDGGANTNQKAVIIRQIVPEGSAAQTGGGIEVGQQILTVNGKSLKGLKHKDSVMAIKSSFDGPLNKTIEFVLLAHEDD